MSFPSSNRLITSENQKRFWKTVSRIQETLEFQDTEFARLLKMDLFDYQTARETFVPLKIEYTITLCDRLGLSLSHFLDDEIDYRVLRNHFLKQAPQIPTKYTTDAFGTLTTFVSIVKYISYIRPGSATKALLSSLQMDPSLLQDPLTRVNIQFYEDATAKVSRLGFDFDNFREIGVTAAVENLKCLNLKSAIKKYEKMTA